MPIYHNDKGRNGDWVPGSFPAPDSNYLYAFDGYPSASGAPPDWGYYGPGGAKGGASASPATPGFEAEFGGGFFDPWGGAPWQGQGYSFERAFDGPAYERQFYLTNVANGIKLQNVYMTFGGTSWGWLPAPVVYTSYDYGAAISEARQLTAKIPAMKELGYFLRSVPDINKIDKASPVTASNSLLVTYHLANPDTGTQFYFVRNDHTADLAVHPAGQRGRRLLHRAAVRRAATGRQGPEGDRRGLPDGLRPSGVLHLAPDDPRPRRPPGRRGAGQPARRRRRDGAPLPRRRDRAPGERPGRARPASPGVTSSWDASTGDLRLNYTHQGLTRILITPATGRPLLLLGADDTAAAVIWRTDTAAGPVLASGPALVRTATVRGAVLALTGDTSAATPLEVWAPRPVAAVWWNGRPVPVTRTASGSLASRAPLSGPPAVALPALTGWKYAGENPEAEPGFDDSGWIVASKTTSASATPVPAGQPVLFMDDYGFHYGDVWYRGSWSAAPGATSVTLNYQTGQVGMVLAWLDGQFLGSGQMPTPTSGQSTTQGWSAAVPLPIPAAGQDDGPHVLAVLVRPMSHQEDGGANNAFKQALGLTGGHVFRRGAGRHLAHPGHAGW